jgi:hypothetical protein
MRPPEDFTRIIDKKRYSTKTATLLAGDDFWDGHNFERHGRNSWLYRTPRGAYFTVHLSQWEGESDSLQPCSVDEAIQFFEGCHDEQHRVSYEEAFPSITVEEA